MEHLKLQRCTYLYQLLFIYSMPFGFSLILMNRIFFHDFSKPVSIAFFLILFRTRFDTVNSTILLFSANV